MSQSESPALTDAEKILLNQEKILAILARHGDEINGLGQNLTWIVENVQGIFQMFGNPQMMSMLGPALSGAMAGMGDVPDGG